MLLYIQNSIFILMNKQTIFIISAIIFLNSGAAAVAKQASQAQAPLIYEYNLKGPKVLELDTITASGTINTISASWDFDGEVSLEASANGGLAYTKIANGQILTDGFIPGNQLRFRINIAEDSSLKKLTVGYTDSSGADYAFHNRDLPAFRNHKPIYISGAGRDLFNYPVKITIGSGGPVTGPRKADVVCEGGIEPDFRDIRFTAADGQTPLAYYQDDSADFWVKIPQIPKEGTKIFLYYGNKAAVSLSNPEAVFLFYDDFNGNKLNEEKWLVRPELKSQTFERDGALCLNDSSVISRNFKMKEGILEFKAMAEKNTAIQGIVHGNAAANTLLRVEETVYASDFPGAEHTIAVNDVAKLNIGSPIKPLKEYIFKVIVNTQGITFERFDKDYEKQAEIRFLDTYKLEKGYIGLRTAGASLGAGSAYFDWVRVRPYAGIEPKVIEEK